MDENTLKLSAQTILEKVFSPNVKGYDAEEVDDFLDLAVADYRAFENYFSESHAYIVELETQLRKVKEKNKTLEIENAKYKNKFGNIKEGTTVTQENVELLNKIGKYEKALRARGVDPNKI